MAKTRYLREMLATNVAAKKPHCPECGQSDEGFEKRADVRMYIELDEKLAESTHRCATEFADTDTDDDGRDVIYCLGCDAELVASEIVWK